MKAGSLRRRVTLQQQVSTVDTFGQRTETWEDLAVVWAQVMPLTGRELEVAQSINSAVSHKVAMRYRADVDASMRLQYLGKTFAILAVMDIESRHRELELLCSEGLVQ